MPASLDLGLIGNCAISALIDREARLVWCCMPRFDSDPVFDALLDSADGIPENGSFQIRLEDCTRTEQSYADGTAVLRTRMFDSNGAAIEVSDFAPRHFGGCVRGCRRVQAAFMVALPAKRAPQP